MGRHTLTPIFQLMHALEYISLAGYQTKMARTLMTFIKWKPPTIGYKLNTDPSVTSNSESGGIGGWRVDKGY